MLTTRRSALLAALVGLLFPRAARAGYSYTGWSFSAERNYYYRKCTFYNSSYYFYAIYKPSYTKQYIYCYNPYRQVYWCACPTIYNPSFRIYGAFISIFILIINPSSTVEGSTFDTNAKGSVPMKDQGGQQIASIDSMPTDLPPG